MGGRGKVGLLLSSSVAALLIGSGAPAAFAACANNINASFDNPLASTTSCVAVTNTSFTGNITNEGTIAPGGITFNNGTITGFISSSGNIAGGISLDGQSAITAAGGGGTPAISITGPTFLGGISNAGTISSTGTGIVVNGVTTFAGGITNAGVITTTRSGVIVTNVSAFSGNLSNSGAINALGFGINVNNVSTFAGAINNSGTVSAAGIGIGVSAVGVFGTPTDGGGIVNSGTIAAATAGILVTNVTTFLGGITNTGSIAAFGSGIAVSGGSIFAGGISNDGTITGPGFLGGAGISVNGVSTFLGGISNSGTIAGFATGIHVCDCVDTFVGGITNSGSIAASFVGISVSATTFAGAINNSGTIAASSIGIFVNGVGVFGTSSAGGGIVNSGTIAAGSAGIVVAGVATFLGGITNSGMITAGSAGISVAGFSTFLGGITNSGTIAVGGTGISVTNGATFFGPISNSGTIVASSGIVVGCACGITLVSGGITNSGTIAAVSSGIVVTSVSTFAGAINNSGTISAGGVGILVSGVGTFGMPTAGGGIVNSGTIAGGSSAAIAVLFVSTFQGGITNQGLLVAPGFSAGIVVSGVDAFTGGISNSGTILQPAFFGFGISVSDVKTFSGGISNSGTISGFDVGIEVCGCVTNFSGGIANSGLIAASGAGIVVAVTSSFGGGISNSGTILAGSGGILVTGAKTFDGGITNSGVISLFTGIGIVVTGVSTFSGGISNSGTITGGVFGIGVADGVRTFTGGINNTGLIAVTGAGIRVSSSTVAIRSFGGGITNAGLITVPGGSGDGIQIGNVSTFSGGVLNSGTIEAFFLGITVRGPTSLGQAAGSFGGGITNTGTIALGQNISSAAIAVDNLSLFTGGVTNSGTLIGAATGIQLGLCGCGISTFMGGVTNNGLITGGFAGIMIGNVSTFGGDVSNTGTIVASAVGIQVNGASFAGGHIVNTGTITAPTAIDVTGALGAMTIDQNAGLLAGDVKLSPNGDTLNVRGGTINGSIVGQLAGDTINFTLGAGTFTYDAAYSFTSISQVNVNSGLVILNGNNDATNVAVNGGVLQVGDSAHSGATLAATIDVIGGTLAGHGTVAGDVTIESGGVLAPGGSIGTLTITNSLTFNPGSTYLVQIAPGAGNNSAMLVTGGAGIATINGGTVTVAAQFGHYNATTYTIVTATGGVSGTFASATPTFIGPFVFSGSATLSYDANDVFLNLGAGAFIINAPGANQNQQNVINGINNVLLNGQTLPPQFQNLANLSGSGLLNALTQFSGEAGAGFLQGAFQSNDLFLNLMVNPFLDGRFGSGGGFGAAMGFAAAEPPALPQAAAAFASAMPVKAPPYGITTSAAAASRVWGSAFGGTESVDGNAAVGSHTTTSRVFGFAAGVDYPIAPTTTLGFALAGGGTNWGLEGGLGGGRSDMFQAGAYGSHRWGAAYISGALSYNFHDVTTDRNVTVAGVDRLTANFQAHGIGARIEGGYRYATPWLGITPYAAAQVQSIFLPGYAETATAGSNQFALTYASQTATATRSELGAWFDKSTLMENGALLTLYGRAAWAHDFGNTPSASAIFQALPGSNFVVNGAVPARDGALVTAGALYRLLNGWSFQAKFDGEFSSTTNVYSGTGVVKKTW